MQANALANAIIEAELAPELTEAAELSLEVLGQVGGGADSGNFY
jgi:hypothetical protein